MKYKIGDLLWVLDGTIRQGRVVSCGLYLVENDDKSITQREEYSLHLADGTTRDYTVKDLYEKRITLVHENSLPYES